jgi:GNAT superfamily N-acetyltransferase
MKILTYRDLKSKDWLLPLLDQAFRWPFNPRTSEELIRMDPRLKDSPVGFCAVENGHAIGFVGVLDLPTRTLDGTIKHVGGIYGVATMPSHARRGICTILMNSANDYFKEKGYRFSFLTTSRTIIAHDFYAKLGYEEVIEYPSAYKVLEPKKAKASRKEKSPRVDLDRILHIYNEFARDKIGLVVRSKEHLTALKKDQGLTPKHWVIGEKGYALFRKDNGRVWIKELAASTRGEIGKLLLKIEEKAKDVVYDRAVLDTGLLQVYKSRDYMIEKRSHSVMMAKFLTSDASFRQTYGKEFYMSSLDWF